MSTNDTPPERNSDRRIDQLDIGGGESITYDAENTDAWIQYDKDFAPNVEECR